MTFPTVKSNPWHKAFGRRKQSVFRLWSGSDWKRICEIARDGGDWIEFVSQLNVRYYGKR